MIILVINCGGSSIKYQVIDTADETVLCKGAVESIGSDISRLKHSGLNNIEIDEKCGGVNHAQGLKLALETISDPNNGGIDSLDSIKAVGHRLVHGGEKITGAVPIDDSIIEVLEECSELAPLHNPPNLMGIHASMELLPGIPQIGVFDTAFHTSLPDYAHTYAIPYKYYEKYKVRRYGFHGIAFTYMTGRAGEILNKPLEEMRIVSLMLGSGTTANALHYGRSVDVSTGLTPCEGLIQSTRCGDIDPAAITYIMRRENLSTKEMDKIINKESGWLGIAGFSNDLRVICEEAHKGNERAQLAADAFTYRAKKYIGAYAAAMGGIDLLVFSGGVGENNFYLRSKICDNLSYMGLDLDDSKNESLKGEGVISKDDSSAKIMVVKMNEELVIARKTKEIVG